MNFEVNGQQAQRLKQILFPRKSRQLAQSKILTQKQNRFTNLTPILYPHSHSNTNQNFQQSHQPSHQQKYSIKQQIARLKHGIQVFLQKQPHALQQNLLTTPRQCLQLIKCMSERMVNYQEEIQEAVCTLIQSVPKGHARAYNSGYFLTRLKVQFFGCVFGMYRKSNLANCFDTIKRHTQNIKNIEQQQHQNYLNLQTNKQIYINNKLSMAFTRWRRTVALMHSAQLESYSQINNVDRSIKMIQLLPDQGRMVIYLQNIIQSNAQATEILLFNPGLQSLRSYKIDGDSGDLLTSAFQSVRGMSQISGLQGGEASFFGSNLRLKRLEIKLQHSLTKICIVKKQALRIDNLRKDPDFNKLDDYSSVYDMTAREMRGGCIFTPIISKTGCLGVIRQYFHSKLGQSPSADTISRIAQILENCIKTSQTFQQLKQKSISIRKKHFLKSVLILNYLQKIEQFTPKVEEQINNLFQLYFCVQLQGECQYQYQINNQIDRVPYYRIIGNLDTNMGCILAVLSKMHQLQTYYLYESTKLYIRQNNKIYLFEIIPQVQTCQQFSTASNLQIPIKILQKLLKRKQALQYQKQAQLHLKQMEQTEQALKQQNIRALQLKKQIIQYCMRNHSVSNQQELIHVIEEYLAKFGGVIKEISGIDIADLRVSIVYKNVNLGGAFPQTISRINQILLYDSDSIAVKLVCTIQKLNSFLNKSLDIIGNQGTNTSFSKFLSQSQHLKTNFNLTLNPNTKQDKTEQQSELLPKILMKPLSDLCNNLITQAIASTPIPCLSTHKPPTPKSSSAVARNSSKSHMLAVPSKPKLLPIQLEKLTQKLALKAQIYFTPRVEDLGNSMAQLLADWLEIQEQVSYIHLPHNPFVEESFCCHIDKKYRDQYLQQSEVQGSQQIQQLLHQITHQSKQYPTLSPLCTILLLSNNVLLLLPHYYSIPQQAINILSQIYKKWKSSIEQAIGFCSDQKMRQGIIVGLKKLEELVRDSCYRQGFLGIRYWSTPVKVIHGFADTYVYKQTKKLLNFSFGMIKHRSLQRSLNKLNNDSNNTKYMNICKLVQSINKTHLCPIFSCLRRHNTQPAPLKSLFNTLSTKYIQIMHDSYNSIYYHYPTASRNRLNNLESLIRNRLRSGWSRIWRRAKFVSGEGTGETQCGKLAKLDGITKISALLRQFCSYQVWIYMKNGLYISLVTNSSNPNRNKIQVTWQLPDNQCHQHYQFPSMTPHKLKSLIWLVPKQTTITLPQKHYLQVLSKAIQQAFMKFIYKNQQFIAIISQLYKNKVSAFLMTSMRHLKEFSMGSLMNEMYQWRNCYYQASTQVENYRQIQKQQKKQQQQRQHQLSQTLHGQKLLEEQLAQHRKTIVRLQVSSRQFQQQQRRQRTQQERALKGRAFGIWRLQNAFHTKCVYRRQLARKKQAYILGGLSRFLDAEVKRAVRGGFTMIMIYSAARKMEIINARNKSVQPLQPTKDKSNNIPSSGITPTNNMGQHNKNPNRLLTFQDELNQYFYSQSIELTSHTGAAIQQKIGMNQSEVKQMSIIPISFKYFEPGDDSKQNYDVTDQEARRLNGGAYKLNAKTLKFLKRMGKLSS